MEVGEAAPPHGRTLNGHVFQPSFLVQGPLATTSFGTALILGYGSTSASLQVGDRTFSGSFNYAGVGAVLGYENAFLPYLSARISIQEEIFSGIDGQSVFAVGTSLGGSGSIGLTASMPVGDSLRLGVLLDAGVQPAFGLTIGNGIRTIVESCNPGPCNIDTSGIFKKENATLVQPAIAASWAPWRPLGLTGNVTYSSVSQTTNTGTFSAGAVTVGLAADFDMLPLWRVPIGLQGVFNWNAPVNGTVLQHVTNLGGGIFYTGRQHLALGVQAAARRFAVEPNVNVSFSTFLSTIGLRYYW